MRFLGRALRAGVRHAELHQLAFLYSRWGRASSWHRPAEILGATTYIFNQEVLQTIPQGENAPLNEVLLQVPGVAQDSFGQVHVRGDHPNVQFKINGVELPEGLSVFGQALETRFARSISLITGALPAQYGFKPLARHTDEDGHHQSRSGFDGLGRHV